MPAQNSALVPGYIHIFNIGVEKRPIFNDESDYKVFIGYLKEYLSPPIDSNLVKTAFTVKGKTYKGTPHLPKNYHKQIELIAYSLHPNRFHLLIHRADKANIESFIRSLSTRYSMYFNKKYKRSGRLFNGPYKSVEIPTQPQLLYLTRYLHKGSSYSSFPHYTGVNNDPWINANEVLAFYEQSKDPSFQELQTYRGFVEVADVEKQQSEVLAGLTLETESHVLERNQPSKDLTSTSQGSTKSNSRAPEYAFLIVAFFALLGIGLTNVQARELSIQTLAKPQVLSETISLSPSPSPGANNLVLPTSTPTTFVPPSPAASPTPEVLNGPVVIINITDGSKTINVRQDANVYSEIVATAEDGQIYKYISTELGWYKIWINEKSSGYVSPKYAVLEQNINQ